jgi:hypothetical protein
MVLHVLLEVIKSTKFYYVYCRSVDISSLEKLDNSLVELKNIDLEDGDDIFFQNVGLLPMNYRMLHPRRQDS